MRNAAVQAFAARRPDLAAIAWANHPEATVQTALAEIGRATAERRAPAAVTLNSVRDVLRRDPLAAEPFLIEGTSALAAGQGQRAEALLLEATRRDPRLPAARFLLADLYVREGRMREGLGEIAALIRRLPKAAAPLTPALAAFAQQPGAGGEVKAILDRNPELRDNVLGALAADPGNAELVLELAGPVQPGGAVQDWQPRLLATLLKAGEYRQAHRLWRAFAGLPAGGEPGLFNAGFEPSAALRPFNWTLVAGAAGVAEPAPAGGLHVMFYGRENAVLASQVLLLSPGNYRLSYRARTSGTASQQLNWALTCLPGNRLLMQAGAGETRQVHVRVPPSCQAQELELRGEAGEATGTADLTLTDLQLERVGP